MKQTVLFYKKKFKGYPDLVTVLEFREMLGGIGDSFAQRLIRENKVRHFYIKPYYYIPKCSVIEYVMSEDYARRRLKVKV